MLMPLPSHRRRTINEEMGGKSLLVLCCFDPRIFPASLSRFSILVHRLLCDVSLLSLFASSSSSASSLYFALFLAHYPRRRRRRVSLSSFGSAFFLVAGSCTVIVYLDLSLSFSYTALRTVNKTGSKSVLPSTSDHVASSQADVHDEPREPQKKNDAQDAHLYPVDLVVHVLQRRSFHRVHLYRTHKKNV